MADSKIGWYWRRLRAMGPAELAGRLAVKLRQRADRKGPPDFSALSIEINNFPKLPNPADAPAELRQALASDARDIIAGRWKFFGHLPLQVDTPPRWHFDYLVRHDLQSMSSISAFDLDHRAQPNGADIKVIWEPSRWSQLTRLAMAAYVLKDAQAGKTCVDWLQDWQRHNPPYLGLNWTSALETGLRLIHFTWIDALLTAANFETTRLAQLRQTLLPHHFWFTARYLSFGSSANNHLLGELAGLAVALARYPTLPFPGSDTDALYETIEKEILLQFAPDGGNREEALSYHLFSYELASLAHDATLAADEEILPEAASRLQKAAAFYAAVKMANDPFEYGDSDNAAVIPFELDTTKHPEEFRAFFLNPTSSPGLNYWRLSNGGAGRASSAAPWTIFRDSQYAIFYSAIWEARLDASKLGYLDLAAHGHLDALHLSLWLRGNCVVIDPGTGAYYADKNLREYLASWSGHNGPHLSGRTDFPKRHGTFLWGKPHPKPLLTDNHFPTSEIELHGCMLRRHVEIKDGVCEVRDESKLLTGEADPASLGEMRVHWKFAPETRLEKLSDTEFVLHGELSKIRIQLKNWKIQKWGNPPGSAPNDLDFTCSPAFRRIQQCPILHLQESLDSLEACLTRFTAE